METKLLTNGQWASKMFPMEQPKPAKIRQALPPGVKNVSYALKYDDVTFSAEMADLILTKMMDGMYLGKVLANLGLKMSTLRKWEKQSPDFANALQEARKTQAYMLVEETLTDIDRGAETVPEASVLKLKVENKRWIAEKYNRDQFAQKVDMKMEHSLADVMDSIRPSTDEDEPETLPIDTPTDQIDTPTDAEIVSPSTNVVPEYIPRSEEQRDGQE